MFYIIDTTTGEVLAETHACFVDTVIDELTAMYPLEHLFVQGVCESGYGMTAEDWVGAA